MSKRTITLTGETVGRFAELCELQGVDPQEKLEAVLQAHLSVEGTPDMMRFWRWVKTQIENEGRLPASLVGIDLDHPVFSKGKTGDGPFEVKIERTG